MEILDGHGACIGRLSKGAASTWRDRLWAIESARVVAIVRRRREDETDSDYAHLCQHEQWELPLVEITRVEPS